MEPEPGLHHRLFKEAKLTYFEKKLKIKAYQMRKVVISYKQ